MGKRSDFERVERDFYPTPESAVLPLLPHLEFNTAFVEPCAGDGALVRHLEGAGMSCLLAYDIAPQAAWIGQADVLDDGMEPDGLHSLDCFITNPPWDRKILHPIIERLSRYAPTWLLFDADWMHTRQSAPFMPYLRKVVSVGRVKWIANSPHTGKDNCAWHLFDQSSEGQCQFYGRAA